MDKSIDQMLNGGLGDREQEILIEKQKLLDILSDDVQYGRESFEGPSDEWLYKWNDIVRKRSEMLLNRIHEENNLLLQRNLHDLYSKLVDIGTFDSVLIPGPLQHDLKSIYLKLRDHLGPEVTRRIDIGVSEKGETNSKTDVDASISTGLPGPTLETRTGSLERLDVKGNVMTGTMLGRHCVTKESYSNVFKNLSKETPSRHSSKYSKIPRCESLRKLRKSWPGSESSKSMPLSRSTCKKVHSTNQTPKRTTKVRKSLMEPRALKRAPSEPQIKKHSCIFNSPPRGIFTFNNLHRNFKATQNLYARSTRSSSPESVKSDDSSLSVD